MDAEYSIPFFAQTAWVVGVFILSLVVFDVVLVRVFKLKNRTWKRVDYIWLAVGALGLIGAVEGPRRSITTNLAALAESRLTGALSMLNSTAQFGSSAATCRKFIKTDASQPEPEFSKIQAEYDQVCAWFRQAQPRIPADSHAISGAIPISAIGLPPEITDPGLKWQIDRLRADLLSVNQSIATLGTLQATQNRSLMEELVHFLGPMLLAIAIALRITKVTGELKNEA